jgi:peptidoglycan/LPS O-acetylase OafA/YrhL
VRSLSFRAKTTMAQLLSEIIKMANTTALADQKTTVSPISNRQRYAAPKSGLKYRADIDGLRAVAVLSVLAFHIGLNRFQGGFVGVDVFFVISGYLISSAIFAEISASRFTIIGFYERRIRRILPALFAMLAASTIAAALYLLPRELVDYSKSMLAATGSASNIYFWWHSGYFDTPTSKPLLHTWSLAVEEQFYLSFPLFLLLVRRFFAGRLRAAVVLLFFASLVASCAVVLRSPDTAFYMPYTRAWELLLGTLLSLRLFPTPEPVVLRNLATLCGIGMILWSVLFYSQETLFPGFNALLPCVGSALIIWAGEAGESLVGEALSWRPVVFIGLISYSLYLWHWPIIVLRRMGVLGGVGGISFGNHSALLSPHRFDMLVEVVLSFVLAVLSWKFVEKPFRIGALRLSGRPLFALAGGVMLVLLGVAGGTILAQGFTWRFPNKALQVASALDSQSGPQYMRVGTCFITTEYHIESYDYGTCLREDKEKKNYLLLGDSHSAMLWSALDTELKHSNVMQASTADCEPSLAPSGSIDCKKMMAYIFQQYLPTHTIQAVFLVGRWDQKSLGSLGELISWTKQHQVHVIVFGPVPEYDAPLPRLLAYSIAWNKPALPSQHLVIGQKLLDAEMQQIATTTWHVPYISLYNEICSPKACLEYADPAHKLPMMGDDNHLSVPGASFVVQRLIDKAELN